MFSCCWPFCKKRPKKCSASLGGTNQSTCVDVSKVCQCSSNVKQDVPKKKRSIIRLVKRLFGRKNVLSDVLITDDMITCQQSEILLEQQTTETSIGSGSDFPDKCTSSVEECVIDCISTGIDRHSFLDSCYFNNDTNNVTLGNDENIKNNDTIKDTLLNNIEQLSSELLSSSSKMDGEIIECNENDNEKNLADKDIIKSTPLDEESVTGCIDSTIDHQSSSDFCDFDNGTNTVTEDCDNASENSVTIQDGLSNSLDDNDKSAPNVQSMLLDDEPSNNIDSTSLQTLIKIKECNEMENEKYLADKCLIKRNRRRRRRQRSIKPTTAKYRDSKTRKYSNTSRQISDKNTLIMNGNCSNPLQINNKTIIIYNTCPFDSLLACTYIGYTEFMNYKSIIDELAPSNKFLDICKCIAISGANTSIYKKRANILLDLFSYEVNAMTDDVNTLDVQCNISFLTGKLLGDVPSTIERQNCENCNFVKVFNSTVINVNPISEGEAVGSNNTSLLKNALDDFLKEKVEICTQCQQETKKITTEIQNQLWIDFDWFKESTMSLLAVSVSNEDLPSEMVLQNKRFFIAAVIVFVGEDNVNSTGHYIAYCKCAKGYWQIHNDLAKEVKRINYIPTEINIHQVLYISQ